MSKSAEEWKKIIKTAAPRGKPFIVEGLANAMPSIEEKFAINTVARQAHFLGQLIHESDGLTVTQEYASGTAYEGRKDLGNTHRGDGPRYKGRGLIQLTGRHNYERASRAFNVDLVAKPELAAAFPLAATIAGWFWSTHPALYQHAETGDVRAVTKIINGGLRGLNSRLTHTSRARRALTEAVDRQTA